MRDEDNAHDDFGRGLFSFFPWLFGPEQLHADVPKSST
jgi:hypothetical protein